MRLPEIAIKNYRFTLMVFLLLTIAGISSFLNMPRTENPTVYIPGASVIVVYPGASPTDLEKLVAIPIEEAINELDDIEKIKTNIEDGIAVVTVEFAYETDPDEKFSEVSRKVNSIKNDLPEDIYNIDMWRFSSSDVAIMQLALVSDDSEYKHLEKDGKSLKKEIERVSGVKKVELLACPEQQINILLDLQRMSQMNIAVKNIAEAISSNNANIPGGSINISGKNFGIKTSGPYVNLEQIKNTVVHNHNGKIVYLKDIAEIKTDYEEQKYIARYNGKKAVFITIKQKENINIFDIKKGIKPVLNDFSKNKLNNSELKILFDQSIIVEDRISGFLGNLFQGVLVVGLLVLLSIGIRPSIIVIVAIPLSIVIGLLFVDLYGLGLQQITIAALVVALGLLVDNSIVISENINRFISMGYNPFEASIKGTSQIGWAVISSTLTTLMAFVPIIMMPDKAGDFIEGLPVTIVSTLSISLLISLSLSPLLAGILFKKKIKPISQIKTKIKPDEKISSFIKGPFLKILNFTLKNRKTSFSLLVLVLLIALFLAKFVGISFFPTAETPQMLIRINLPEGSSINETDKAARFVESVLETSREVKQYGTNVGHGNPRVYYNIFSKNYAKNYSDIYVQLKKYDLKEFNKTVEKFREKFREYPGAKISVKVFEQGIPTDAPVMVYIDGENVETLKNISGKVQKILEGQNGIYNIENKLSTKRTNLRFNINREKANMYGVPVHEIDRTIRMAFAGTEISEYRDKNGKEYDIVLKLKTNEEIKLSDTEKIYVTSLKGKNIPLKQFVNIELEAAPGIISRRNLQRTALITADFDKSKSLDELLNPVMKYLEDYPFPVGYSYHIGGEKQARKETFGGMGNALIIAVIAIFAILVLQFNSFLQPFIILFTFPLGFIGVVLALLISGFTFSFTAFIGFISLAGIVINNAIILVDYTNQLKAKGRTTISSLKEAAQTRFKPILLTTLTTIGGLLPLTLQGSEMWSPMGWTIIGGLLVSTALTLLVVPLFYMQIEAFLIKSARKKKLQKL